MVRSSIQVSSVTYAMKAKQILALHGIRAEIERTRQPGRSCSYSVRVPPDRAQEAEKLLSSGGIRLLGRTERSESS